MLSNLVDQDSALLEDATKCSSAGEAAAWRI